MKKVLAFLTVAAALIGLSCGHQATLTTPTIIPSPTPTPAPPEVLVQIDIKPQGGGAATSSFPAGVEMKLEGTVQAFDANGQIVSPPPVASWRWSNFSDVQARCQIFGEVNSAHPHAQCDAPGTFVVQAVAVGFDGSDLGQSSLLTAVVF